MKKAPSTFCFGPSLFLSLLLGMALLGCSETSSPDPVLLSIVAGDGQEAVAGTALDSLVDAADSLAAAAFLLASAACAYCWALDSDVAT